MYYKIAVVEIMNFMRGTHKGIHFSGSGFTIAIYSFPKYWILLQAFVRIVSSFQEHSFHRILHNYCFQIWLSLNWGWLNPWYSGRLPFRGYFRNWGQRPKDTKSRTNLIFVCTDFHAHKVVLRARLYTQNYVCIKQW